MKRFLPFALVILASGYLRAEAVVEGLRASPLPPIKLSPTLTLATIEDPKLKQIVLRLSEDRGDGKRTTTTGDGARPGEKYAYLWVPEDQTMWFATPKFLHRITLNGSLSSTSALTTTTPSYRHHPEIPQRFQNAIALLLKE